MFPSCTAAVGGHDEHALYCFGRSLSLLLGPPTGYGGSDAIPPPKRLLLRPRKCTGSVEASAEGARCCESQPRDVLIPVRLPPGGHDRPGGQSSYRSAIPFSASHTLYKSRSRTISSRYTSWPLERTGIHREAEPRRPARLACSRAAKASAGLGGAYSGREPSWVSRSRRTYSQKMHPARIQSVGEGGVKLSYVDSCFFLDAPAVQCTGIRSICRCARWCLRLVCFE